MTPGPAPKAASSEVCMSPTTSMGVGRISARMRRTMAANSGRAAPEPPTQVRAICCGRDAGGGAGLAHRLLQRLAGLGFADADDVAGAGGGGGEEPRFVAHDAGGLGSAAVDAEVVGHGLFLTQRCGWQFWFWLGGHALAFISRQTARQARATRGGDYRVSLADKPDYLDNEGLGNEGLGFAAANSLDFLI